jgi:YHS domain-containing protein
MKIQFHIFILFLILAANAFSQTDTQHLNINNNNIAVDGYDLVSYFSSDEPQTGNKEIKYTYKNAHYYFSSIENLNAFKSNPKKYLPAFGGWCAYSMAKDGEKEKIDAESFLILKGKLYLFYDTLFRDHKDKWLDETNDIINKAEQNWKKLIAN